jgi:hypothetical protein
LFDVRDVPVIITVVNGMTMEDSKAGSLRCNVEQGNGNTFQVLFQEVNFVLGFWRTSLVVTGPSTMVLILGMKTLSFIYQGIKCILF